MPDAHRATRVRSIFELCRLSTGNAGTTSTAAVSTRVRGAHQFGERAGARPGRRGLHGRDHHDDDLLGPGRADADDGRVIDSGDRLDGLLDADRCHGTRSRS